MRVICVQEDGEAELFTEASDGRGGLAYSEEGPLALGHANHDGHAQLMGGCRHRLQRDEVRTVEVPDSDVGPFGGVQDFPQRVHGVAP